MILLDVNVWNHGKDPLDPGAFLASGVRRVLHTEYVNGPGEHEPRSDF
jgi:hypothetical protein